MIDYEPPAIQNTTQACYYCGGKLVAAEPLEVWEVHSGERFAKVKCANDKCRSMAWRPEQPQPQKKA